jgi:DNA mismatch repair protein MSH2
LEGINTPTFHNKELIESVFLKPLAVSRFSAVQGCGVTDKQEHIKSLDPYTQLVEDTIELDDIHHGKTVLKPTLSGDLEQLQQELIVVRDQLDDEHDRVAKDLGVEKNKKLHLENHQVYHYSLRITKAVRLTVFVQHRNHFLREPEADNGRRQERHGTRRDIST